MKIIPSSSQLGSQRGKYRAADFSLTRSVPTPNSQVRENVSIKREFLAAMQIFRDVSQNVLATIEASTSVRTVLKGEIIYRAGDSIETIFVLKRGGVHLYQLSPDGRKLIVERVRPPMLFGGMPVLSQPKQSLFAEAVEECRVCQMKRADVERLILSNPNIGLRLLEEIGMRIQSAHEHMSCSAFKAIPARLATLLLNLSENGSRSIAGVSQQDLADMLGIFRETISVSLGALREQGIIEIHRMEIAVRCRKSLLAVANQENKRNARRVLETA